MTTQTGSSIRWINDSNERLNTSKIVCIGGTST